MAKRIDLRAYQENIATRLAAAQAGEDAGALLCFVAGGQRWLIDLPAAGEVLPLPPLAAVPLTRPWFAGLANVHGELRAVVDFPLFCGGHPAARDSAARLLCVGTRLGSNLALLVDSVQGLKRADALFAVDTGQGKPVAAWCGATCCDPQGQQWTRIDINRLLADPAILDAALPDHGTP